MLPQAGAGTMAMKIVQTFPTFTVPDAKAHQLDFVEFSRRAFVQQNTTVNFANGVLSEFKSTDPSIATGVLTLATDALKSVVFTVPLVK
jgi:hypothetical protein